MGIPVDGLVITYDDTDYAATGSVTGHHATRAGLAYKWADVSAETVLDHIEWSCAASTISPAVSYTHLDVYKRQQQGRVRSCDIRLFCCGVYGSFCCDIQLH